MIRVVARFQLKAGLVEQAKQLAQELIDLTRTEDGCISYDLAQSVKDESALVILEAWETQKALDIHSASEHFNRLVPQLADLCTTPPVVDAYQQLI